MTNFTPPIPTHLFPALSIGLFLFGFVLASGFGVSNKSIGKELTLAALASVSLAFSTFFLTVSIGLYP